MEQSTGIHPLRNKLKRENQIYPNKELYQKAKAEIFYKGQLSREIERMYVFCLRPTLLMKRGQRKSVKQGNMSTKILTDVNEQ